MLPFSLSSVSMWGAVFNLLFTPVAFGIRRLCLGQLTWRWWWRRRWWRGRGGRVGLDSSGLIYLNAVRYLGYLWSFSLMGQSQKADTCLISWLWSCFRLVSNQRTRQSRKLFSFKTATAAKTSYKKWFRAASRQSFSLLFHLVQFVKCLRIFLELNSTGLWSKFRKV